jgi:hypothetical protein
LFCAEEVPCQLLTIAQVAFVHRNSLPSEHCRDLESVSIYTADFSPRDSIDCASYGLIFLAATHNVQRALARPLHDSS